MASNQQKTAEEILFYSEKVNLYELGQLCQQAYAKTPKKKVGDWKFFSQSAPNGHGYYGVAYLHPANQCIVIAHRGTDPTLLSNLLSDASLAFSKLPRAQNDAKSFSEEVRNCVSKEHLIIETGHSLGGFHAEMNIAMLQSGYAMTFESPGTGEICETLKLRPEPAQFVSFFSIPNVVNTAKPHIGSLYQICAYRMDKNGLLKIDHASYLQPLTQVLMKAATPVESAVGVGISVITTTAVNVVKRQVAHHSLEGLIRAMHPGIGYPWVMRKMLSWPSLAAFLKAQAIPSSVASASAASSTKTTVSTSQEIPGYSAGNFICAPNLHKEDAAIAKAYRVSALKRFDGFYEDLELRQHFIRHMKLDPEDVKMVFLLEPPLPSTSSTSLSAFSSPASSAPQRSPNTPTQKDALTPKAANTSESSKPKEKVVLANSLVSDRYLIEEKKWVISLVKSPGEREHAFLLLEGIKDGVVIQLRTDFLLDLDARQEITAKLPMGMSSAINTLWGSSEHLVGRGFVRAKELQPEEYENLLGGCEHQSWSITQNQAEKFVESLIAEMKKPYAYAITGNHPTSSASSSSGIQAHNCASWCQAILRETLDFSVGSEWSWVKRPSTIVRQAMQENGTSSTSTGSSSNSGSFFSSSASRSSAANTPPASLTSMLAKKGF